LARKLIDRLGEEEFEPLKPEEEIEYGQRLAEAILDGDLILKNQIRDELVKRHLRLVLFIGKNYRAKLDQDEIFAVGSLALVQAADRWDIDRGSIYQWAKRWITTALTRASDAQRIIRLPEQIAYKAVMMNILVHDLTAFLGRPPTKDEIIAAGGTAEMFEDLPQVSLSLDQPAIANNEFVTVSDTIVDDMLSTEDDLIKREGIKAIYDAISELTDMEQEIISSRFGLTDDNRETLQTIGDKYGFSGEAARRIEASALSKLRHPSLKAILEDFF